MKNLFIYTMIVTAMNPRESRFKCQVRVRPATRPNVVNHLRNQRRDEIDMVYTARRAFLKTVRVPIIATFLVISLASFTTSASALATPNRFVNPDGVCGGSNPCHTTIQAAVTASVASDVIEVQTNSTYAENVVIDSIASLTLQNKMGDSPTISPASGVGLIVKGSSPGFTLDGVNVVLPKSSGSDGFRVDPPTGSNGVAVLNVTLRGRDVVDIDTSIDGLTFDNVVFLNASDNFGLELDATDFGGTIKNVSVTNSSFIANFKHVQIAGDAQNITLDGNFFDRTTLGEGILIEKLASTAGPIDIINNIIIDSQEQGVLVRTGTNLDNISVVGNTIANPSTFNGDPNDNVGITFRNTGSGNVIGDNIVVTNGLATGYAKSATQSFTFDHNLEFNTGSGTESGSESPIALDVTSISGNPVFIDDSSAADDFRLSCASADIGTSLSGANMGAEQTLSAATCTPCMSGGGVGDDDGDGVDGCFDLCPSTPSETCVDSDGCRVRTSLFGFGATWHYDDTGADVSGTFKTTLLSSSGPGQLGFGEGDEATTLTKFGDPSGRGTYYFNETFTITDVNTVGALTLDIVYDDGYVVHINGTEVARSDNMIGAVTDSSLAFFDGENWLDRGIVISPSVLVTGTNTIAVEMHQETTNSSDISFDASLDESPFCPADSDGDGVPNDIDQCPDSSLDLITLNPNQYAQNSSFGPFEVGPNEDQSVVYDMTTTSGCTCAQIIESLGVGEGHSTKGCSPSVMEDFIGISADLDRQAGIGRR